MVKIKDKNVQQTDVYSINIKTDLISVHPQVETENHPGSHLKNEEQLLPVSCSPPEAAMICPVCCTARISLPCHCIFSTAVMLSDLLLLLIHLRVKPLRTFIHTKPTPYKMPLPHQALHLALRSASPPVSGPAPVTPCTAVPGAGLCWHRAGRGSAG